MFEVIQLLHGADVLLWETSREGYASLRLKSTDPGETHSSMNCKQLNLPQLIIGRIGFLLLPLSTRRGHLVCR